MQPRIVVFQIAIEPRQPNTSPMSEEQGDLFEPKMGKRRAENARSTGRSARRIVSFHRQVMQAVARAGGDPRRIGKLRGKRADGKPRTGRFNARGRGAKVVKTFPMDSGWKFNASSGQRMRMRRVVVKARVVKLRGPLSRASYAHLRYLQRDGVSRECEPGQLYGPVLGNPDGAEFLDRGKDDRHQFRFIVAPEDGVELDLRSFTRELMEQMEQDLDTRLDWVAVNHHNTGHPHSHVVVRGITDEGKTLNIAGDYIARGIRFRAGEILTRELGLQNELEVQQQLDREVDQERFTRLDRDLAQQAGEKLEIDTRPASDQDTFGDEQRYRLIRRLKKLERMGLAKEEETGHWKLSGNLEKTLRAMGERGDIIKTMHREMTARGIDRGVDKFVIHHGPDMKSWIAGRVIGKGLALNEMTDRIHLVVDGADGRVHYAEMLEANAADVSVGSLVGLGRTRAQPRETDHNIALYASANGGTYEPVIDLSAARDEGRVPDHDERGYLAAHIRRLEALQRAAIVEQVDADTWRIPGDFQERARDHDTRSNRQLGARVLSIADLDRQVQAHAATWLDRELITEDPRPLVDSGFGRELHTALLRRQEWLVEQGLAHKDDGRVHYPKNLIAILARRELDEKGREIAQERGGTFHTAQDGEYVSGRYKGSVQLVSGKYALLEQHSREFTLVPWRPDLEWQRSRTIGGLVRGGEISWEIGRSRGLGISM
jgi:type IV secretory pathway VirD2 relaxase